MVNAPCSGFPFPYVLYRTDILCLLYKQLSEQTELNENYGGIWDNITLRVLLKLKILFFYEHTVLTSPKSVRSCLSANKRLQTNFP